MKITFEGRDWELDPAHVTLKQAFVIQGYTGLSLGDWEDSLDFKVGKDEQGNEVLLNPPPEWLKSLAALYWLMKSQSGTACPVDDVDFDVNGFVQSFVAASLTELQRQKAEREAADAARPTSRPSTPGGLPSPAPSIPVITTLPPPVPQGAAIAST